MSCDVQNLLVRDYPCTLARALETAAECLNMNCVDQPHPDTHAYYATLRGRVAFLPYIPWISKDAHRRAYLPLSLSNYPSNTFTAAPHQSNTFTAPPHLLEAGRLGRAHTDSRDRTRDSESARAPRGSGASPRVPARPSAGPRAASQLENHRPRLAAARRASWREEAARGPGKRAPGLPPGRPA